MYIETNPTLAAFSDGTASGRLNYMYFSLPLTGRSDLVWDGEVNNERTRTSVSYQTTSSLWIYPKVVLF